MLQDAYRGSKRVEEMKLRHAAHSGWNTEGKGSFLDAFGQRERTCLRVRPTEMPVALPPLGPSKSSLRPPVASESRSPLVSTMESRQIEAELRSLVPRAGDSWDTPRDAPASPSRRSPRLRDEEVQRSREVSAAEALPDVDHSKSSRLMQPMFTDVCYCCGMALRGPSDVAFYETKGVIDALIREFNGWTNAAKAAPKVRARKYKKRDVNLEVPPKWVP